MHVNCIKCMLSVRPSHVWVENVGAPYIYRVYLSCVTFFFSSLSCAVIIKCKEKNKNMYRRRSAPLMSMISRRALGCVLSVDVSVGSECVYIVPLSSLLRAHTSI